VSDILHERARIGALSRSRANDDPELVAARQSLKALRLEEYVLKVVAEAPPLTPEVRDRIAQILRGGAPPGGNPHAGSGGSSAPTKREEVVRARIAELDGGGKDAA
jgi:hypothetical protein